MLSTRGEGRSAAAFLLQEPTMGCSSDPRALLDRAKRAVGQRDLAALMAVAGDAVGYAREPDFSGTIAYIYRHIETFGDKCALNRFAADLINSKTTVTEIYLAEIQLRELALKEAVGLKQFVQASRECLHLLRAAARVFVPEERRKRRIALRMASLLYFIGADDDVGLLASELAQERANFEAGEEELAEVVVILRSTTSERAYEIIRALADRFPQNTTIAASYANLLMKFRAPSDKIVAILEKAIEQAPTEIAPLRWLAVHLVDRGMWARAEPVVADVVAKDPRPDNRLQAATVLLRVGKAREATGYMESLGPRLAEEQTGALTKCLRDLVSIVNRDYRYSERVDIDLLRGRLKVSSGLVEREVVAHPELTPNDLYKVAEALHRVAFSPFSHFADKTEQFLIDWTECHGTFDVDAYKTIFLSLLEHVALLTDLALSPEFLARRIEPRFLLRELAGLHTDTLKLLGRTQEAKQKLEWLISLGLDGSFFKWLRESCDLRNGDLEAIRARKDRDDSAQLHPTAKFDEWCALENLRAETVVDEAEIPSGFEFVRSDGVVRRGEYSMPAFRLFVVRGVRVLLRDSELVFGPRGTLMSPHVWHCRRRYPAPGPIVINQERSGTLLKRPSAFRHVDEPVVVVTNNDCEREPNYYHWTILILARIHHLLETGQMAGRRLLLPSEMKGWMYETLKLIGVPEEMIVAYGREESVMVADGLVVSPIESVSRSVLCSLRRKMWREVGVEEPSGPLPGGSLLFLVRRNEFKRLVMPINEICEVAETAGFQLIAPEDFSVTAQVRMFAAAQAIAGPAGAAFTNMLFCREGTKVMSIMKEESTYPTYTDLAIALDLPLRYCLGETDRHYLRVGYNVITAPYRVDLEILARQLDWAVTRGTAGPAKRH